MLVVGTAKDLTLAPRSCSSGYLRVYAFREGGKKLELIHIVCLFVESPLNLRLTDRPTLYLQTEVDDVPTSLLAFQGRLVAGVGKALRIYDIGKKKMLRKCENNVGSLVLPP